MKTYRAACRGGNDDPSIQGGGRCTLMGPLTGGMGGGGPLSFAAEIIIEIKQFNPGPMASHASIESVWCTHSRIFLPSKMYFYLYKSFCILMWLGHFRMKYVK